MQKVLLLGDSIRMFYQKEVERKLGSEYQVMAPEENCRFSYYTLNSLRFWLSAFSDPDIIHWNIGLWDLAILYPQDGCFIKKELYVENMKKILRELKKTGAKIIFATTTPVKDEKQFCEGPFPPANRNADIKEYNQAVLEAFENEDVEINDLFSLMYPGRERLIREDMVHPNEEGIDILSDAVTKAIVRHKDYRNQKCVQENKQVKIALDEKTIQ